MPESVVWEKQDEEHVKMVFSEPSGVLEDRFDQRKRVSLVPVLRLLLGLR